MPSVNAPSSFSADSRAAPATDGISSRSNYDSLRLASTISNVSQDNEVVNRTASQASNVPKPRTGVRSPHVQIWAVQKKKNPKQFPKNTALSPNSSETSQERIDKWRNVSNFGRKIRNSPEENQTPEPSVDLQEELNLKNEDIQMLFKYFVRKKRVESKQHESKAKELREALKKESERAQVAERKNARFERQLEQANARIGELEARFEREKSELEERLKHEIEKKAAGKLKASKSRLPTFLSRICD